jgi:hypothetical protein
MFQASFMQLEFTLNYNKKNEIMNFSIITNDDDGFNYDASNKHIKLVSIILKYINAMAAEKK